MRTRTRTAAPRHAPERALARALDAWLAAHPPASVLAYADRLLVASVIPRAELPALVARAPELVQAVRAHALTGALLDDPTGALVACALLDERGVDMGDVRMVLAPALMVARGAIALRGEPTASTFAYWQHRAHLGKAPGPVGPAPADAYLALYHHAHAIFLASAYGAHPVARRTHASALDACVRLLAAHEDNADCTAEVLLACACTKPPGAERARLTASLASLALADGSLRMPAHATDDARHHAVCVALLALTLSLEGAGPRPKRRPAARRRRTKTVPSTKPRGRARASRRARGR